MRPFEGVSLKTSSINMDLQHIFFVVSHRLEMITVGHNSRGSEFILRWLAEALLTKLPSMETHLVAWQGQRFWGFETKTWGPS